MNQPSEHIPFGNERQQQLHNEIDFDNSKLLAEGSSKEMTSLIYDTLFRNIEYPQFDMDQVGLTACDPSNRHISFEYMGHQYEVFINRSS